MAQIKEVLNGIVTLGLNVKTADGILAVGTHVKMSADNEVEAVDTALDNSIGYVLVANTEVSGKCTVATRGKRVSDAVTGIAYPVGSLLMLDASGKTTKAYALRAIGIVTIQDYSAIDSIDTVTVNAKALTAGGTDWTAATSNAATALSLAQAINAKVASVRATQYGDTVVIESLDGGTIGNGITLATSMTATTEGVVSGATLSGGKDFAPLGVALEAAGGADETKSVLWF